MIGRKGNKAIYWWAIVLLTVVGLIVTIYHYKKNGGNKNISYSRPFEPSFVKEGTLYFLDITGTDTISKIVIEIVDNDNDRTRGLMYRRSMPDSVGMLFVFEEDKPQAFWMKNTYIALDIIYVNSKLEVVSIQECARPFSEVSLPSNAPAMYVVEVNARYCYTNGIKAGCRIAFIEDCKEMS